MKLNDRISPKQDNGQNSPPRINIIKQKVNLNKINVVGGQNSAFVNHSHNFQNKRPNFGGGLAQATNNVTQNRLGGVEQRNPVLNTEDDEDDVENAVYE